jgi:serine/threonine protein kinase
MLFFRYCKSGILSMRNDVYSFGIILLELITGQLPISKSREGNLRDWVKSRVETSKLEDIVDEKLQDHNLDSIWKVVEIALSCTTPTSHERPTMMEVLSKLKQCVEVQGESSFATNPISSQSTFDIGATGTTSYDMGPMETSDFFNPKAR